MTIQHSIEKALFLALKSPEIQNGTSEQREVSVPDINQKESVDMSGDEAEALNELHAVVGSEQVSYDRIASEPKWLIEKAEQKELNDNWKEAYEEVNENDVPKSAKFHWITRRIR